MPSTNPPPSAHDDPELFAAAINYTAAETGFSERLIEKDYYCTVALAHLYRDVWSARMVFKGGTCLVKVHSGFYRLSEDLDFMVHVPVDASRSQCRVEAEVAKRAFVKTCEETPAFSILEDIRGANNSKQYFGTLGYPSVITNDTEPIKYEVSLREPLLTSPSIAEAQTVLLDPINGEAMVEVAEVKCLGFEEALAEKFRAALTRRDVAIRDYFDLMYAIDRLEIDLASDEFVGMVREKIRVPGNPAASIDHQREAVLRNQMETHLKPVLRSADYSAFDLEQAIVVCNEMATRL